MTASTETLRTCQKCREAKPESSFYRSPTRKDGLQAWCKGCSYAWERERRRAESPEKKAARREYMRIYRLIRYYGLSKDDYDRMLALQGGLCAICRQVPPTSVDHDHATGVVRGLLCIQCNAVLGQARDRVEVLLQAAITYLRAAQTET